ncbi:MAG: rRNA pseudouridine synthase [Bacilli bacterium]|nr:rRNA pseudouridine synthase [Bacilli bacterium]
MVWRIDRLLSQLDYGSRSEIHTIISQGRVRKNGVVVVSPKIKVDPENDIVTIDGEKVFFRFGIVLMLNKPKGVISANRDDIHTPATGLVKPPYDRLHLNIAGRLDIDAEGLLLLTNDGKILHRIISPTHEIGKLYEVEVDKILGDLSILESGVEILDGKGNPFITRPAEVRKISERKCELRIHEGKYHQVKRMFASLGYGVINLKRIAIGKLYLDQSLEAGAFRELSDSEIAMIFAHKSD